MSINKWHSDFDVRFIGRATSPYEERMALTPLIAEIVNIAAIAKRDSILKLEEARAKITDPDLAAGLLMLIDGVEIEDVLTCIRNRIIVTDARDANLLRLLIVGTGLVGIYEGREKALIMGFLCSYLGDEALTRFAAGRIVA